MAYHRYGIGEFFMKNNEVTQALATVGLAMKPFYIPHKSINYYRWAVIACDQYCDNAHYWEDVAEIVGNAPSTLRYIIPEIYLCDRNIDARVANTLTTMHKDVQRGIFTEYDSTIVLCKRSFSDDSTRYGLIIAIDLEEYDVQMKGDALICPTEETFQQRVLPRLAIRSQAILELPHTILLYNDPNQTVINTLLAAQEHPDDGELLYQTDLMLGGGSIQGYAISDEQNILTMAHLLQQLNTRSSDNRALFFVGDGNHSLAAAKEHWLAIKRAQQIAFHPARYALVELVNIYDPGLKIEPIHHILVCQNPDRYQTIIQDICAATNAHALPVSNAHRETKDGIVCMYGERRWLITVHPAQLAIILLHEILAAALKAGEKQGVLFVHDEDEVLRLHHAKQGISFLLPPPNRAQILEYVTTHGALPKKSFSLGRASEKRFYFESRVITE